MAALFKSSDLSGVDRKFHYTPARTSSDEGEGSLPSDGLLEKYTMRCPKKRAILRRYAALIVVHILIFLFYLVLLYLVASSYASSRRLSGPGLVLSPAREAVVYEEHSFSKGDRIQEPSVYSGKPSPELDLAWHNLLDDENIRFSAEMMDYYGREDTGVAITDGSGYVGTLNVYHQLHCIKRLHQYMYYDHYFNDSTPRQKEMNQHCLDFLRQSAMCHGDIGLITFHWTETSRLPVANATIHECINWQKLDDWTKNNSVNMFKNGPRASYAWPGISGRRG